MEYEKVQYIKKKYYPVKHFTIITIAGKQKIKFLYCISKIKNNIYIYIYIYVYIIWKIRFPPFIIFVHLFFDY